MNNKDPIQGQTPTFQSVPENSVTDDKITRPMRDELHLEEHSHEKEIDLNELFPDVETNLNDLFPDVEVKHLLKSITKNKKDLSAIKERLTTENTTPDKDKEEELANDGLLSSE